MVGTCSVLPVSERYLLCGCRVKRFVAMKVVKSAEHYTETAVDEIKLLRSVSSLVHCILNHLNQEQQCMNTNMCQ